MIGDKKTNEFKNTRTKKLRQLQPSPLNTFNSKENSLRESMIGDRQKNE